ncbi:pentatricopeptide repeat-containing protein At5g66520-like isoform X2 [Rosa rugosa]|uniref:pentatricopeptide repeat-containing protein At5g66520-like isoform X2 n=1 Tax=Rosa rugosa TaxID=74645 RepID=UPI002B417542|nr:pentatricopeptide repeat-containing protein At5g66520-like isoform X2 [Rosa rugosa]
MAAVAPPSLPNQNKLPSFSSRIPAGMPAPVVLLQMCSNFQEVRQVHAQLVVSGLIARPINGGRLLQAYVTVSNFNYALSTFDSISNPDVFAYNTMMRGLILERVLAGFSEDNTLAKNSLISGYLSQGQVESARKMFDNLVAKDDASWSAMVAGYTKNGMYAEALVIFRKMLSSQVSPNESALVSSLCACANLGALDQGKWIHAYIDRIGARISVTVGTALIDMYAKCGSIENAYEVFRKMPQKDVVSWGAIISGFAIHGRAVKCFELFDDMVAGGIHPNEVIFVGILSACSHAGYVETGYKYFDQMVRLYGIKPSTEHYGCMVDLLGRAGRLAEAEKLITSMPEEPNSVIWGAFLGACRMHSDVRRGNLAFKHLTDLEPTSGDRYKLAGIMFANAGEKENATKIRKIITDNDLETTRGVSSIEIDGVVHEFVAGTINHSRHKEIYRMWERVNRLLEIHELEICIPF